MPTAATAAGNAGGGDGGGAAGGAAGAGGGGGAGGGAGGAGAGAGAGGAAGDAANQPFWQSWSDPADKDIREWVGNKNFPDIKTLARSAHGYERLIGADKAGRVVALPAEEYNDKGELVKADPEGRAAFNAKIGVPASPDKYDIPQDPNFPEFKGEIAKVLFNAGVPARMASQIAKGYDAVLAKAVADAQAKDKADSEAGLAELQRTWGTSYKENAQLANRGEAFVMKRTGATEVQMREVERVLGTPGYMKMLHAFGAGNTESRFAGDGNNDAGEGGGGFARTASQAQARINQITADRSSGKITDFEWRNTYEKEMLELGKLVAAGAAPQ